MLKSLTMIVISLLTPFLSFSQASMNPSQIETGKFNAIYVQEALDASGAREEILGVLKQFYSEDVIQREETYFLTESKGEKFMQRFFMYKFPYDESIDYELRPLLHHPKDATTSSKTSIQNVKNRIGNVALTSIAKTNMTTSQLGHHVSLSPQSGVKLSCSQDFYLYDGGFYTGSWIAYWAACGFVGNTYHPNLGWFNNLTSSVFGLPPDAAALYDGDTFHGYLTTVSASPALGWSNNRAESVIMYWQ